MFLQQSSRAVRQQWRLYGRLSSRLAAGASQPQQQSSSSPTPTARPRVPQSSRRQFHATRQLKVVKPVLLADIGEGIVECEIIQWFVEPGARVEEFSPLCEVQSDKASVEITSRFAGVVKKLHYEAGEMAKVGKAFVDIDIEGDVKQEDLEVLTPLEPPAQGEQSLAEPISVAPEIRPATELGSKPVSEQQMTQQPVKGKHASLATPAVRHLSQELNVDILQINGSGKDGRVLKEDIYRYVKERDAPPAQPPVPTTPGTSTLAPAEPLVSGPQVETATPLTRTQEMMFKTMTRSLNIPHFLYADEIDFSSLVELRSRLNKVLARPDMNDSEVRKLSYLPFVIKAVSLALYKYPILNSRVETDSTTGKPTLVMRSQHNIGVAMDTPSGLLVPVIKNVGSLNVLGIAAELTRLQALAHAGKLSPQDMTGGTITVSNIGNIGGTYLSPVVVEREVAILGIGRMRTVPAFSMVPGEEDKLVRKQICNFSWSADHRVIDGATMARAAEVVRTIVEEPDVMVMHLR